jgi:hypothetical protein
MRARSTFLAACAFVALPLSWSAAAQVDAAQGDAPTTLTIRAAPGLTARVTGIGGSEVTVHLPRGATQRLTVTAGDEEGRYSAETADFNFDGFPDLAFAATLGQVNDQYQVFLFDPAARRFVELSPPKDAPPVSCDGFWNLKPDPQTRTLFSSCRSGPIWYTDAYRFDSDGRVYVYRSANMIMNTAAQALLDSGDGGGPASLVLTFNPKGRVVARSVSSYGDGNETATGRVEVGRLPLHEGPADSPTRRYLIQGDTFEALDISDDEKWLKVAYRNPARGRIEGWIKVDDATPPQ